MDKQLKDSEYINEERRQYSLYVLQHRAIPHITDGLKPAARRVLWMAKDGKKYKTATLAGATMPIHPHASPDGAINSLTGPYVNNIPLFKGYGAFGTLLAPTAFGASRYTSVEVSNFTHDVVFKDIEIIPMVENYDSTLMEPKHFLPLIPLVLLNENTGIAVGFASTILPRSFKDIVKAQISYLEDKKFKEPFPTFSPTSDVSVERIEDRNGNPKWIFHGDYEVMDSSTIRVTKLPYGLLHEKFIDNLSKLIETSETYSDFDDYSRDVISVVIKTKRGVAKRLKREDVLKDLGLVSSVSENMNVLDFDGEKVWAADFKSAVERYSDWRLGWYETRYKRLAGLIEEDIQRYKDILTAIKHNVGGMAKKIQSRAELKEVLEEIKIVHIDYIANLPVYRFTEEEKKKVEEQLKEANATLKHYMTLLKKPEERRKIYIQELNEVLKKYG